MSFFLHRTMAFSIAVLVLLSATASQAALIVPVGNSLVVNDTDLDVAWTQDANLFRTQAAADPNLVTSIINVTPSVTDGLGTHTMVAGDFTTSTGAMNWWGANAWVNYLNSISYAGETDWRLPIIGPVNGSTLNPNVSFDGTTDRGFNSAAVNGTASELAHLFYHELGNLAQFNTAGVAQTGFGVTNAGPFANLGNSGYWSGTEAGAEYAQGATFAWIFGTANGGQGAGPKINQDGLFPYFGWAVSPGQVAPVPVPAAVYLFGSGLIGLAGLARRQMKA